MADGSTGYWDWRSDEERASDGAVSSRQSVRTAGGVVPPTRAGALRLSTIYWREVQRATAGLVRARARSGRPELRILAAGPVLLRFGSPEVTVDEGAVWCAHSIDGGLLCRRPGGRIWFEQRLGEDGAAVVSGIGGFYPRLAARPEAPAWTGELYKRVQSRLHVAIARRYFARLVREASR